MMSNGGGQAAASAGSNGGLLGGFGGLLGGLALGGILPSLLGGMKGIDGKQIGNDVYQGVKQGIANDIKSAGQTVWNGVKAAYNNWDNIKGTAQEGVKWIGDKAVDTVSSGVQSDLAKPIKTSYDYAPNNKNPQPLAEAYQKNPNSDALRIGRRR